MSEGTGTEPDRAWTGRLTGGGEVGAERQGVHGRYPASGLCGEDIAGVGGRCRECGVGPDSRG